MVSYDDELRLRSWANIKKIYSNIKGYAGTAYGFVGFEDERDAEVRIIKFFF
jgi:hypothetical protein